MRSAIQARSRSTASSSTTRSCSRDWTRGFVMAERNKSWELAAGDPGRPDHGAWDQRSERQRLRSAGKRTCRHNLSTGDPCSSGRPVAQARAIMSW